MHEGNQSRAGSGPRDGGGDPNPNLEGGGPAKAKAWSAFVERGLAVQIASAELALDVNGAFTGQENLQFSVCFTDRKLSCFRASSAGWPSRPEQTGNNDRRNSLAKQDAAQLHHPPSRKSGSSESRERREKKKKVSGVRL
mmetsp:Transcript_24816/g.61870  ORF Transcript_24816/g.61870 Transcript_24816/m.61870 type:complete len:140 (-) Transcript_24816:311-730(-)